MRGGGLFGFVFLFVVVLLFGGGGGWWFFGGGGLFVFELLGFFLGGGWFSIQYFCYLILVSAVVYMSNPQAKLLGFFKYAHF